MIEVRNLVKRYGNHIAVDHLDFQLEPGRIYGFLGPNGAGKSTTMNMMTGYLGATEGSVLIDGHDILKEPEEAKKHIGYLPEIPPLYVDMTVEEYLEFAAELKAISRKDREEAVEKVMELTKLSEVRIRLIKNLSKGYRQRVGLAQALLGFPDIIILDEPTVGLDPKQIIEIRELIRNLSKEHTVILSSHILAEVREVCDYIMIISKGKLVASDTPENLEHLMAGQNNVEIEVRTEPKKVKEILGTVPEVRSIEAEKTAEGATYAKIQVENPGGQGSGTAEAGQTQGNTQDVREKIFLAFAEAACPLLMLKTSKASLEEVFMELTQGEEVNGDAGDL